MHTPMGKIIFLTPLLYIAICIFECWAALRWGWQAPSAVHVFDVIPAISKPALYLRNVGNEARAELVESTYSFQWAAAFLTFLLITGLSFFYKPFRNEKARTEYSKQRREAAHLAAALSKKPMIHTPSKQNSVPLAFMLLALVFVIGAWFESYSFESNVKFANTVHVKDLDLIRPTLALTVSLWFFIIARLSVLVSREL